MRSPVFGLAGVLAISILLAGCAGAPNPVPTPTAGVSYLGTVPVSTHAGEGVDRPSYPPAAVQVAGLVPGLAGNGLVPYLAQKIAWVACGTDRCAQVLAPLDYAHPGGQAVTVSFRLHPASRTPRLGTLFINPGGPGASGKELVSSFQSTGLEQYDIVGWDPRGTGDSTPVRCLDDAATDALLNLDSTPDDAAERVALAEGLAQFGKACWERNGELLAHIGTTDTARDLDLLRQLLGDRKLNYLGYSYGTQIGATYAELFGPSTGRLVLDSAVNITDDDSVIQAQGFDLALGNYAQWCATSSCGLGRTRSEVLGAITSLFDRLDAHPLAVGDRQLTQSLAVTGVAAVLYGGKEAWPAMSILVQRAINGHGESLLAAADQLNFRDETGHYGTLMYAFPAISCPETRDDGVLDADRRWVAAEKKAPIFGKYFGPEYGCALWPVRADGYLKLHITGAKAAPLLVIGSTGDNATPYQYAQSMAKQLTSAVLVTYDGEGHAGYGGKSACLDQIVVKYLAQGVVPKPGTTCR